MSIPILNAPPVMAACSKCFLILPAFWCGFHQCRSSMCRPCLTRHLKTVHELDIKVAEQARKRTAIKTAQATNGKSSPDGS